MIPLTFLYDEYIDRPKFSEQKNPFEYIFPPPPVGSEQGTLLLSLIRIKSNFVLWRSVIQTKFYYALEDF